MANKTTFNQPQFNQKLFKDYKELDEKIKKLEKQVETLKSERAEKGRFLVQYMQNCDIERIVLYDKTFFINKKLVARIGNQDEFYAFLEAHNEDGIIKRTVHAQTLNSWAKEWRKDGKLLPESLIVTDLEIIGMRKV